MTDAQIPSRGRKVFLTLTSTLGLLLITNVFWSVWAACVIDEPRDVWFWDGRYGAKQLPANQSALVNDVIGQARTNYSVVILSPDLTQHFNNPAATPPFEDIAPVWIEHWMAARGDYIQTESHAQWDFQAVGWPVRVLWMGWQRSAAMNVRPIRNTGIRIVEAERGWGPGFILPIRPILWGQVIYAIFWLTIVVVVSRIRRSVKLQRSDHRTPDDQGN